MVTARGYVVSTGFNGAAPELPHCLDVGCLMAYIRDRKRCVRTLHAEDNALRQAGHRGDTLYTTGQPCYDCLRKVLGTQISRVIYAHDYEDAYRDVLLRELTPGRLTLVKLELPDL